MLRRFPYWGVADVKPELVTTKTAGNCRECDVAAVSIMINKNVFIDM